MDLVKHWTSLFAVLVLSAFACDNRGGLNNDAHPSPSPTPTVAVTVTPPPCPAGVPTPGPAPNVDQHSLDCGNANKAVSIQDTFDGDGDAFICVWLCTSDPTNGQPVELLQSWNLTAEDGDANSLISSSTLPCCTWQP